MDVMLGIGPRTVVLGIWLFASIAWGVEEPAPVPTEKPVNQKNRKEALERFAAFMDPPTFERAPYYGRVTLSMGVAENTIGSHRLRHLSYNGGLVGPTIRVQPGDLLEIRVENRLPVQVPGGDGTDPHGPHGLHSTNLHPHGLHISPEGESDNTFIRLDPGDSFNYRLKIDWNQPAGTYWYHPHKHGSVAYQLTNGLAGALIVEGGMDQAPELEGVQERVMVFQQFSYRQNPEGLRQVYPQDIYSRRIGSPPPFSGAPDTPREDATAINGVLTPMITMRPGEVQRWRMIHAGVDSSLKLNIEQEDGTKVKLHEIAVDGIPLGKVAPRDVVLMEPGYRSDVLVQIEKPGNYLLYTEVKVEESAKAFNQKAVPRMYVAKIFVDGPPRKMNLPPANAFAAYRPKDIAGKVARERTITFDRAPDSFTIDGAEFDPAVVNHVVQFNTVEDWNLVSERDNHPFHIHVNSFQEFIPGPGGGEWLWRDTLMVPAGETRKVRHEFLDYTGRTVLHCHNLDHEDQGMMQIVKITKDAKGEEARARQVVEARVNAGRPAEPAKIPAWNLLAPDGTRRGSSEVKKQKLLLIFHRGVSCAHCAQQLVKLGRRAEALSKLGIRVVAVSSTTPTPEEAEFATENQIPFPLLADPELSLFEALKLTRNNQPVLHAAFLVDGAGQIQWSKTGEQPPEVGAILEAAEFLKSSAPKSSTKK